MKKTIIFNKQNVTNLLAFSKDTEVFEQHIFGSVQSRVELSEGLREKSNPLPIINSLAVKFFEQLNTDPDSLLPQSLPDKNIIVNLIKEAYENIDIDYSSVFLKLNSSNTEYLLHNQVNLNGTPFSLTFELIQLFYLCWNYTNGERAINWDFYELRERHIMEFERKYKKDSISPLSLYHDRLGEVQLIPADLESEETCQSTLKLSSVIAGAANNPLSLAWFELFCAVVLSGKYSLCTFCGKTFSLYKMRGNGVNKATCSDECKKRLQQQRNERKRLINPEEIRKQDRLRQDKKRAIDNVLSGKYSIEESAQVYSLNPNDLFEWVKNKK